MKINNIAILELSTLQEDEKYCPDEVIRIALASVLISSDCSIIGNTKLFLEWANRNSDIFKEANTSSREEYIGKEIL